MLVKRRPTSKKMNNSHQQSQEKRILGIVVGNV